MIDSLPIFIFWILLGVTFFAGIGMQWSEKLIKVSKEEYKKNFLIRLQFAKSRSILQDMINSVSGRGRDALGFNLGIDYAFMIGLYGFLSTFSYLLTASHQIETLHKFGGLFSWLMIVPFIADIFENYCLARWSFNEKWNGHFGLYYLAVRVKWLVAALVGLFCFIALIVNLVSYHTVFFR
jgi:hypothetical protein